MTRFHFDEATLTPREGVTGKQRRVIATNPEVYVGGSRANCEPGNQAGFFYRRDRKEAAPRTCEFRGSAGAESVGDDDGN